MSVRYDCARLLVRLLCAVALLSLAHAARAAADAPPVKILLLTPARTDASESWGAVVRGLHDAGLRAVEVADLPIDPVFAACSQTRCAVRAASAAHMPALLGVVSRSGHEQSSIELHWLEGDGNHWSARAALQNGGLAGAVTQLAERLRRQRLLGDRALLHVDSVPVGATVTLDGQLAGLTPFEREWSPGPHVLELALDGRDPDKQRVQLSSGALQTQTVELRRSAPPVDLASTEPTLVAAPTNTVLGSVLLFAAAPLLATGMNGLIDRGQCLESSGSLCSVNARFGSREGILFGSGLVIAAAGAYFLIARPLRIPRETATQARALPVRSAF